MLRKVRITSIPKARTGYQVQGALANDVSAFGGADYDSQSGRSNLKASRTLTAVPKDEANLEAEGGETVVGNLDGSMMPSFKTIKGPRHTNGGVPLSLPDDSFIFSDTKSMMIKDPTILKMFNKPAKKGGYTPAELSKKFDLNPYREILQNPESDSVDIKTAELMIKAYTLKLGALALAQESKKAFPQGIPEIAKPYMEANGIMEEDLIPQEKESMAQNPMMPEMQDFNEAPAEMPDGQPVAMAQNMENMSQEMMMYGGTRRLRRAQEGMQQPSQEEMMMQQQGQQSNNEMAQIMQQVQASLQEGIDPSEVVMSLLQNSIPPEGIIQIFTQLGASQEEAMGLVQQAMSQGQETQSSDQQQMAKYGMSMGGFYPEYAFGGDLPKAQDAGQYPWFKPFDKSKTVKGKITRGGKKQSSLYNQSKDNQYKDIDYWVKHAKAAGITIDGTQGLQNYIYNTLEKDTKGKESIDLMWSDYGATLKDDKQNVENFADGYGGARTAFLANQRMSDVPPVEKVVTEEGSVICTCTKTDGTTYEIEPNEDGSCPECEETTSEADDPIVNKERAPAEMWLQDKINMGSAFGDMMRNKKYMPWETGVDLQEPRPVFLDPTRELAANSEQANIASQAASTFAGPQGLNSRLSQIQGQGSKNAADILSKINNQNINMANQFEQLGTNTRNQESMANQAMRTRLFDKNTVANQQFDNSKRAFRHNFKDGYNTALTNKWKTDALNQMYPNYQVDPRSGGRVFYNPTEKALNNTKDGMTDLKFAESIKRYDAIDRAAMWKNRLAKKHGGQIFKQGGFVYTVFPTND